LAAEKIEETFPINKLLRDARILYAKNKLDEAAAGFDQVAHSPGRRAQCKYYSALCYFEMGNHEDAIASVKTSQGYFGYNHDIYYPLGFLLLGKIYEKKGDTQLAIQNYEKFLDLWKDADPDLPDLIEAKARLAKLKGGS
jgi:tetratricopeptide (TPR) repeat protein